MNIKEDCESCKKMSIDTAWECHNCGHLVLENEECEGEEK